MLCTGMPLSQLLTWHIIWTGSPPAHGSLCKFPRKTFIHCFEFKSLDRVIMVPPTRLLWVLRAGLNVEGVIGRPGLLFGGGKHGDDGETDGFHAEGRRPIVGQDRQADVAIAIDVLVHRDWFSNEGHLGGVKGVLHPKLELQGELFSLIECVWGTF